MQIRGSLPDNRAGLFPEVNRRECSHRFLFSGGDLSVRCNPPGGGSGGCETKGLQVLYTFERPKDGIIRDRSGVGEPLDLRIDKPQGVNWRGGGLTVSSGVRITSPQPARKLIAAVKQSGELTIEAWVKPKDLRQDGPARIVSLSADPGQRNVTLGQEAGQYDIRLRTTATSTNGIPSMSTGKDVVRMELTHVVYTRDPGGMARIYLNGNEQASQKIAGDFSGWSDEYGLSLANEMTGDRPWLGELHLVAIFSRALSAEDVSRNFAAGAPSAVDYAALLPQASSRKVDFVQDVQPLLKQYCFECHTAGNEEGGLNLGVRQRVLEGGDHGPVLVKGDSASSRLIHFVAAIDEDEVMPPSGDRLSPEQIGVLRAWIDQGAAWPDGADVLDPRAERAKSHWAFQPLHDVPLPEVRNADWCRTPIDRFILTRLEAVGLQPTPPANSRKLMRRTQFDVIGLPPTPEEMEDFRVKFERDPQPAFESLVDQLLASRHYGERWGRHWLDLAHYADSSGMEGDRDRPNAYHFRDFVIRALNEDMPFDQFVRWQIAGDEYEPDNPAAVSATGLLAAGPSENLPDNLLEEERLRDRYNELDDMLSTIGTGMLGLTLGCARCHDHKYDAIPARDYYRLMCALHSGDRADVPLGSSQDKAFVYRDFGPDPKPTWLFKRADYHDRQHPVQLGFVSALTRGKSPEDYWIEARQNGPRKDTTYQRRALAEWIDRRGPRRRALLARVIVNRLWQHHFGEPLVRTVGDFGVRSEPPTHPELLEWLANDLVRHGWKLKRLHRLMLTSAAYQQDSIGDHEAAVDPENRLLWKMRPQRLEAEILRDSLLAVSGTLNLEPFGPGVQAADRARGDAGAQSQGSLSRQDVQDSPAVRRRSVYMFHKRVVPYPLLQAFDKPDAQQSCGRRDNTTVAPQALALLNDPFVRTASSDFADRLLKECGNESAAVDRSGLSAGARPSADRRRIGGLVVAFIETQIQERTKRSGQTPADEIRRRALADFCQAIFGLNEFLYVD